MIPLIFPQVLQSFLGILIPSCTLPLNTPPLKNPTFQSEFPLLSNSQLLQNSRSRNRHLREQFVEKNATAQNLHVLPRKVVFSRVFSRSRHVKLNLLKHQKKTQSWSNVWNCYLSVKRTWLLNLKKPKNVPFLETKIFYFSKKKCLIKAIFLCGRVGLSNLSSTNGQTSSLQNIWYLRLYWLVHRDPYSGLLPIPSMYGIFPYIWLIFMVNVGKNSGTRMLWDTDPPWN